MGKNMDKLEKEVNKFIKNIDKTLDKVNIKQQRKEFEELNKASNKNLLEMSIIINS